MCPFALRDKTDAHDAQEAIWVAAGQSHILAVPVKSEQQQACLAPHRMRAQFMKMRIMQTNALRDLLYEFGIILPEGHGALLERLPGELADAAARLPGMLINSIEEQMRRVRDFQQDIDRLDKRVVALARDERQMRSVRSIPGVGPLTATALMATAGEISGFRSGRQFAAWLGLGLAPRQTGTSGKIRQLGISKRGSAYVRTLLMHGVRAVIARGKHSAWLHALLVRRPYDVAVVALANKLACTAWAVLVKGRAFDPAR